MNYFITLQYEGSRAFYMFIRGGKKGVLYPISSMILETEMVPNERKTVTIPLPKWGL